jgi:hypothetical protein
MVTRSASFAVVALAVAGCTGSFKVTPSGSHVTISPAGAVSVVAGDTQAFTVTPDTGYATASTVGGTCPAGSWSGTVYTTGAIEAACTVTFSATLQSFTVTASAPGGLNITPSEPQTVTDGSTQAFTVTAETNYTATQDVGGSCPAGSWSGDVYTTGPITADCTVAFGVTMDTYTVTVSGTNVTIDPSGSQATCTGSGSTYTCGPVNPDGVVYFVVAATSGHTLSMTVGGTCPAGGWSGTSYTTGAITANCTVEFSAN